jgi:hypothetical protein
MRETVGEKIQQNFNVKILPNLFWPRNPPNRRGSVEKQKAWDFFPDPWHFGTDPDPYLWLTGHQQKNVFQFIFAYCFLR